MFFIRVSPPDPPCHPSLASRPWLPVLPSSPSHQSPDAGKVVRLNISQFSLSSRTDLSLVRHQIFPEADLLPPDFRCLNDSLEVRLKDPFDGSFYCGTDLKPGTILVSDSPNVSVILHNFSKFRSRDRTEEGRRLKIDVEFVERKDILDEKTTTQVPATTSEDPVTRPTNGPDLRPNESFVFSFWRTIIDSPLFTALRHLPHKILSSILKIIPSS